MNDQHAHAGYAAHDGYQNGSYTPDPLFGTLPDGSAAPVDQTGYGTAGYGTAGYENGATGYETGGYQTVAAPSTAYGTGPYDSGQWDTGGHQVAAPVAGYDAYATPQYDTSGQWATVTADSSGQWNTDGWTPADQPNGSGGTGQFDGSQVDSGQFASTHFDTVMVDSAQFENTPFENTPFESTQFENGQFQNSQFDSGQFQNVSVDSADSTQFGYDLPAQFEMAQFDADQFRSADAPLDYEATAVWTAPAYDASYEAEPSSQYSPDADYGAPGPEPERAYGTEDGVEHAAAPGTPGDQDDRTDLTGAADAPDPTAENAPEAESLHMAATMAVPTVNVTPRPVSRAAGGGGSGGRGRRRTPAKRSALLTIAVPSACVMGVAGIAAASVSGLGGGEDVKDDKATTASAADTAAEKPAAAAAAANKKLDTQITTLSEGARDFGDRASRTQERIDLQARQEADRKKRIAEEARKEAERPKFVLPVSQHGLSAYYGQAGVNWMSVHTGIDFPVSYGTPVMAATDGTVRTQYNSAYGNMAIVTSPDGTETWYCHLSSTKIRTGSVKAGDVIAYSGSSGNSTGPHLHFEVRPGAGSAVDPLQWLRSHGVDPT
ncbi:M23 family metallopeptidase [Streptomyces paludis]|uniref:M23 family metallopeptidase n=1 Tax=Streptomyces paludis TaxID=2282738 RepID=UPI001E301386|nr:M23 family metallopeptidase [Streptomyces paludis]